MHRLFLGLNVWNVLLLCAALVLGWVRSPHHVRFGILAAVFCCLVQSGMVALFIGAAKLIKEHVGHFNMPLTLIDRLNAVYHKLLFTGATATTLMAAAAILGGVADTGQVPMPVHLAAAVLAFGFVLGTAPWEHRLLTRLHGYLRHLQPDLFATAVIARFHPDGRTLTWAAAGHPPPVLRLPDGRVRTLDAKPGAMLGIPLKQDIGDHTERLPPGSTLALYTDGLVERRARGIDPGIERLAAALGSFGSAELDADLEDSADRILRPLLSDSERDDDVCLLLCHLRG